MNSKPQELPKLEANAYEMRAIEYLAALDAQAQRTKGTLEQRLRLIPGGWRDICMVTAKLAKLLEGIYATMTPRQYHHMEIMANEAEVFVRQKPVVRTANSHLVPVKTDDLRWIVNAVMSLECSICLKSEREQKGCELRKRLMCLAPPLDIPKNRVCPYLHVVTQNDPGDYVKRQDYEG